MGGSTALLIGSYTLCVVLTWIIVCDRLEKRAQRVELRDILALRDLLAEKMAQQDKYEIWEPEYKRIDNEIADLHRYLYEKQDSLAKRMGLVATGSEAAA